MDRTNETTKRRIVNFLQKMPTGVSRTSLRAVTGSTTTIHQALDELIREGTVVEVTNKKSGVSLDVTTC